MGTHLKVLDESFSMNTNKTVFRWFSKYSCSCALEEGSLSIKRVRAVPFKSVGGRRNGRFFEGGEGPNSELVYTIRVYMISGRRGRGVSNF